MNQIKVYTELTYIETFDGDTYTTEAPLEMVKKLMNDEKFIQIGDEVLNTSSIKKAFRKELSEIDKILISIKDKEKRKMIEKKLEDRRKEGLRINTEILTNILDKYLH